MPDIELCRSIRHVKGGYIVNARWPYGSSMPFGDVICKTLDEVFSLLDACDMEHERAAEADDGK